MRRWPTTTPPAKENCWRPPSDLPIIWTRFSGSKTGIGCRGIKRLNWRWGNYTELREKENTSTLRNGLLNSADMDTEKEKYGITGKTPTIVRTGCPQKTNETLPAMP